MTKSRLLVFMMCLAAIAVQAQVKVCMSYDDLMANKWKPYEELIPCKGCADSGGPYCAECRKRHRVLEAHVSGGRSLTVLAV